jgi:RNA polymerase sigma factor (sigma-70 family)
VDMITAEPFSDFYTRTKARVFRAVVLATGDFHASEDAVAEAYAKASANWTVLFRHPNPIGWVIRTALNEHASARRKRKRETPGIVEVRTPRIEAVDPELMELVTGLPRRQREVLALRTLLRFTTAETAMTLGVAEGTVKAHLNRALASLRAQLGIADSKEAIR